MVNPLMRTPLDWVIVGWQHHDGVMVLASDQLYQGELEAIYDHEAEYLGDFIRTSPVAAHYRLEMVTKTQTRMDHGAKPLVVMCYGKTYAEALRKLMDFWQPDESMEGVLKLASPRVALDETSSEH